MTTELIEVELQYDYDGDAYFETLEGEQYYVFGFIRDIFNPEDKMAYKPITNGMTMGIMVEENEDFDLMIKYQYFTI